MATVPALATRRVTPSFRHKLESIYRLAQNETRMVTEALHATPPDHIPTAGDMFHAGASDHLVGINKMVWRTPRVAGSEAS